MIMFHRVFRTVAFVCLVTLGLSCFACLWDQDTLLMERQRFPSALELITGRFLRHSPDFYRWRIEDRESRIESESTPELFDDLAVSYEKVGDTENAIRVIKDKDALFPGLYTTHANLGTFYFHAGRYEDGLKEIDKALAINADAHFGREVYQKRLVEYLLSKKGDGELKLPLSPESVSGINDGGFAQYLLSDGSKGLAHGESDAQLDKAVKGVLGMMKFGNYDSPILLEVLGDLLLSRRFPADAKQLAARAYLKASYESTDEEAKKVYRKKALSSLKFQTRGSESTKQLAIGKVEREFAGELRSADEWYQTLVEQEKSWISTGVNVDEAFGEKYYEEPVFESESVTVRKNAVWIPVVFVLGVMCVCVVGLILKVRGTARHAIEKVEKAKL